MWVDEKCATCGHYGTDHLDGGPSRSGYTTCMFGCDDNGVPHCDKQCREYLPVDDSVPNRVDTAYPWCDAVHGTLGFICTRRAGHAGRHIAHGRNEQYGSRYYITSWKV